MRVFTCSAGVLAMGLLVGAGTAYGQVLDRSKRPTMPAPPPVIFPAVRADSLSNGLRVQIVENHSLPLVAVRVAIAGGSLLDPAGKEGLFTLDTLLLRDGTASMSGEQLAEAIDELGAPVTPTRFTTVTNAFERSLMVLGDMLMHPAFPAQTVEQRRAALTAGLQRAEGTSSTPALRIFNIRLFGSTHPFARINTMASLASITRDDVVAFHDRVIRPQNLTITVVGDVTPASAMATIRRVFGAWARSGERIVVAVPSPPASEPAAIYLYDRPGSPQSTVVVGQTGPVRSTPDFYSLEALGALFGGPTGSRLTNALREQRPLTYSISHLPVWRRANDPSSFFGSSNVAAEKTDSAIVVWMTELRALAGPRVPTENELAFARTVTVRSLATRLETIDEVANRLNVVAASGLSPDYYRNYIAGMERVTVGDLARVASRYIDPSRTTIVVVGDRAKIEPGLRAANIGPLIVVDSVGRVVQ